ncbi:MAG: response regulator transcription factor [Silicimonas sp.]|nr:response regulator transcription factor [Silicimonas sp.]
MPQILIADDHGLVRDTIAAFLGNVDDFEVSVGSDLPEALALLGSELSFDLAILDYNMPGMEGLEGLKQAVAQFPVTKFALMSGVATAEVGKDAMAAGAVGFFPKSLAAGTMVNAVKFVLSGESYMPLDMAMARETAPGKVRYNGLTEREVETLRGLCAGQSNKEIARDLDLQEVTIKLHVKNILAKLGVNNRTQAALRARDDGFS